MSTTKAKEGNKISDHFEFNIGVKHSDCFSSSVYVGIILCYKRPGLKGHNLQKTSQIYAYIDDIVIVARFRKRIVDFNEELERQAQKTESSISESKTKYEVCPEVSELCTQHPR